MSNNSKNVSSQGLDQIYLKLATSPSLWELKQDDFLHALSKSLADGLSLERVSLYLIADNNEDIAQKNQYISSKQKHYSGLFFNVSDFPILLKSLRENRIWGAHDSANSSRLIELREDYILPLNIGASLYCTMLNNGHFIGGVCVEHVKEKRIWTEEEKRFLSSVSDLIAQRLITTTVLKEKDERYRAVFENSVDGIFLLKDSICIDCNDAALELFNCERQDILQKSGNIFSPEYQASGESSIDFGQEKIKTALQGEKQAFQATFLRPDGSTFSAEVKLNRVEIMGLPYLLASIHDISKRKISESKLALTNKKVREQNECLAIMNELSNRLQGVSSVDDIYRYTIESLVKMPLSQSAVIYKVNKEKKHLKFHSGIGFSAEIEKNFSILPFNEKFDEFFRTTGQAIYSADLSTENRFEPQIAKQLLAIGIQSMIEIPFIVNGERISVLYLTYGSTNSVSPEILELLFSISKTVSLALDNAQSRSELAYMAHHDSLTDLGNRAFFHTEFNDKNCSNAALYLLDLDRFKEINDTLGHLTGDRILQLIGPRLSSLTQHHEYLVYRLGGDEFIILVDDIKTNRSANDIALAILECLRKPFKIDDLTLDIDCSIGVALFPQDGSDSHELLRSADVAMYQAKKTGSGFTRYQKHLDIHTPERLTMIAELGSSISSGQLFLHYQPKIDLLSNKVVGFEALARWNHPSLGLLGPNLFIPLIEMSNSIYQLTEEVLHQALAQQKIWLEQGHTYSVAVNISARNLIDERIIKLLKEALETYQTPVNMLELEITETALMSDVYQSSSYLKQISDLGILISIDDFGTGYSSLAYMHKLPIDKLKLDREFIMGMLDNQQGEHIVQTIITLSKTLELDVIAEGVEDLNTLEKLKNMQCDQAQGYYICVPDTWENIEKWLDKRH